MRGGGLYTWKVAATLQNGLIVLFSMLTCVDGRTNKLSLFPIPLFRSAMQQTTCWIFTHTFSILWFFFLTPSSIVQTSEHFSKAYQGWELSCSCPSIRKGQCRQWKNRRKEKNCRFSTTASTNERWERVNSRNHQKVARLSLSRNYYL